MQKDAKFVERISQNDEMMTFNKPWIAQNLNWERHQVTQSTTYFLGVESSDWFFVNSLARLLPVGEVLDPVDAHEPVFRGVRFVQVRQLKVLVADLHVARSVKPGRRAEVQLWDKVHPCQQLHIIDAEGGARGKQLVSTHRNTVVCVWFFFCFFFSTTTKTAVRHIVALCSVLSWMRPQAHEGSRWNSENANWQEWQDKHTLKENKVRAVYTMKLSGGGGSGEWRRQD